MSTVGAPRSRLLRLPTLSHTAPFSPCPLCPQACAALGDWRRALGLHEAMVASGVRLDNGGLLALVRLLEANGQAHTAARVRGTRSRAP